MKKFIRVRIEFIHADGGPHDDAIEEKDTFFFYPNSGVLIQAWDLYRYIKKLVKELKEGG